MGVLQVDWPFFGELCRALALKVYHDYDPELVLGIAKAGVIPGAVVASILQRDFASMAISRTESGARPVGDRGSPQARHRAARADRGRDVRLGRHDEAGAGRGARAEARRGEDRRLASAPAPTSPISTPSRPRASSSFPGIARSSWTGRSWCGPTTPRSCGNSGSEGPSRRGAQRLPRRLHRNPRRTHLELQRQLPRARASSPPRPSEDQGGFVRALHDGCGWGIAAFTSLDQLPAMVARAGELSRAVRLDRPIRLAAVAPVRPRRCSIWTATCAACRSPRRSG